MSENLTVADGQVVSMDYTLKVEGDTVDDSKEHGPIEFLQGKGSIIPGLERALYGMSVGDSKDVVVSPADGYGLTDDQAFMDVSRDQFPEDFPLEVGTMLQVKDQSGQPVHARIDRVEEQNVRLDFNHPMAGKELHFSVTIAAIREATSDEIEHGHAHSPDHQH
jgi:FKBP-type peptidyl-prolyl cis-trans isomerase SlyD